MDWLEAFKVIGSVAGIVSVIFLIYDRDPPPLKWSDLRYVFDIKEDCNGKEAIQARRDRRQVAAGRCSGLTRPEHGGRNPPDRRERGDVLSVAPGVRRPEDRAGEAPEGP